MERFAVFSCSSVFIEKLGLIMKYIIALATVLLLLLIFGIGCTEEERQQQLMNRQSTWAGTVQENMFFFQEKESQLCFAVVVGDNFNITHVPCEPVKNLLVSAE